MMAAINLSPFRTLNRFNFAGKSFLALLFDVSATDAARMQQMYISVEITEAFRVVTVNGAPEEQEVAALKVGPVGERWAFSAGTMNDENWKRQEIRIDGLTVLEWGGVLLGWDGEGYNTLGGDQMVIFDIANMRESSALDKNPAFRFKAQIRYGYDEGYSPAEPLIELSVRRFQKGSYAWRGDADGPPRVPEATQEAYILSGTPAATISQPVTTTALNSFAVSDGDVAGKSGGVLIAELIYDNTANAQTMTLNIA